MTMHQDRTRIETRYHTVDFSIFQQSPMSRLYELKPETMYTELMDEHVLKLFEEWGVKYVIEYWGWPKDTTREQFSGNDFYEQMKDAYEAGINEAWGWDKQ